MRRTLLAIAALAFTSSACSHGVGEPSPGPLSSINVGTPAAAAPKTYRVPVDGLPSIGDARALVTVVAFTDYQCPYCRKAEGTIEQLRRIYGSDLRVVVVEKPLPMHDRARAAATAALAAAAQGAYAAMRERLFAGPLTDEAIARGASDLGLDAARFQADRSGVAVESLARSEAIADRLDVRGTPTFFVNGRRIVGAQPIGEFRAIVDERLAAARALVESGVRPEDVYATAIAGGAERVEEPTDEGAGADCGDDDACKGGAKGDGAPSIGAVVEKVPTDGAPSRGATLPSITIVEFADYQCPFCARAESTIHAVEQAHPGEVRVVFKNRPLPFHAHARAMAKAALAAGAQGRFWEMHDRLFALGDAPDRASLDDVARTLGLDVARFDRDLDDASLDARIDADDTDATALDVKGTPTFFVNGRRIVGAQPAAVFEQAIAKP